MTKKIFQKGSLAIFDQILVSGGNFIVVFALARYLSKVDFGIFVIAQSLLMLSMQLHTSLISSPIGVLVSPLDDSEAKSFIKALNPGQVIICLMLSVIVLLISGIISIFKATEDYASIFVATASIIFFYLGQSYIRYILFSRMRVFDAFKNDLICYGLQALVIIMLLYLNLLNARSAIFAIGFTSMAAWFYGLYQCREYLGKSETQIIEGLKPCYNYGKWLVGTGMLSWCRANLYLYLSLFFLGVNAPAILKAAQTIFGPTHLLLNGIESIVPQYATRLYRDKGLGKLHLFVLKFTMSLGVLFLGYAVVVGIFGETIINLLYKGQYVGYGGVVQIVAMQYVIISLLTGPFILLRVRELPKLIFKAYSIEICISSIIAVALIIGFGVYGAAASKVVSALCILSLALYFYKKSI